jgi:hypothetical protein
MTTTLLEAFFMCQQKAYGKLGNALVADNINNSGGSGYVEDHSEFAYSKMQSDEMRGLWVWRYNLDLDTDNDALRRVLTVDTATYRVTVDGGTYADVADFDYVLVGLDPRLALDAMRSGFSEMNMRKEVVLAPGGCDWDMENPTEDFWDGTEDAGTVSVNVTPLKAQAGPDDKVTGEYSLTLQATGASPSQLSSRVRVTPGTIWTFAPCFRVTTGTWAVQLYNDTAGAVFGDSHSYSGAEFAYCRFTPVTIPDGCNYIRLKFTGTGASDAMILDSIPARLQSQSGDGNIFQLEDWIDDFFRLPLIHRVKLTRLLKDSNVFYPAPSRNYAGDLVYGVDYQARIDELGATAQVLDFEPQVDLRDDVFYLVTERKRRDVEPFDDILDATGAPTGELMAWLMPQVCALLQEETSDPFWANERNDWEARRGGQARLRADTPYQPPHETIKVRM